MRRALLIAAFAAVGMTASANEAADGNVLRDGFFLGDSVEEAFDIESYVPSAPLGKPVAWSADVLSAILRDGLVITGLHTFREEGRSLAYVHARDGRGAYAQLVIVQPDDVGAMRALLLGSFDLFSAPLKLDAPPEIGQADRLVRFGRGNAVGARGDVMVSVMTSEHFDASALATATLAALFGTH